MSYFKKTIKIIIIIVYIEFASAKGIFDSIYAIGLQIDNAIFCNDFWYPKDFFGLKEKLTLGVYGQPFVKNSLIPLVKSHYFNTHDLTKNRYPLMLSFHGPSGVGKSFVSEILSSAPFIKNKLYFSFIENFSDPASRHRDELYEAIDSSIKDCERSVFVFDHADNISSEVINSLNGFMNENLNSQYGESMFIFIFQIGSEEIYATTTQLLNKGLRRDQFNLNKFRDSIKKSLSKGNYKSIFPKYINHIIPFLPLEKEHIKKYVKVESNKRGYEPTKSDIEEAYKLLELHPGTSFPKSGFKQVLNKLRLVQARKTEF